MKVPGLRWFIVPLLFVAAVLNYIDRRTLSLLAPTIQKNLGFLHPIAWILVFCLKPKPAARSR